MTTEKLKRDRIWKFDLGLLGTKSIHVQIPSGFHILGVGSQTIDNMDYIVVLAEVFSRAEPVEVKFNIVFTGYPVPPGQYVGTVSVLGYLHHVYQE